MKKLLLVLFLLPTIVFGRKFYVSNSGSDANSFSAAQNIATPWATLSKVQSSLSSFTSGDSILFARGSGFSGTFTVQSKTGLYFGAYGTGADPLFWGTGATISSLVTLRTCSTVVFHNWNISDTTISFTDRTVQAKIRIAFQIESNSTGVVIRKCTMDRIGYGAYITRTSRGQTMDSCDIGNLRMIRNTPTSVNPDDDYGGVPVQISSRNNIFTNNYLHDCYSVSYDYGYDGGGVEFFEEGDTIMNNVIMYNTFYDCNGTFEFGSNNDGIANNPQINNVIAYNKVINSSSLTYINNNGQYRTYVRNLQFYNNVIIQTVASRTGGTRMLSRALTDTGTGIIVMKNNIFQISNGASVARSGQWNGADLVHTNNIYKLSNGSITNFTLDPSEISTSGTIWFNTANLDPISWNYNLVLGSPAINAGVSVGLTRDFNNQFVSNIPDVGILEYSVVTPPACTFTYSAWSTCLNGTQSRTYSASPAGCTGTPRADSLVRPCTLTCTFTYSAWSICLDSFQSRTFTKTPVDCTTNPPSDSILRKCNSVPDTCGINYSFTTSRSSCLGKANGSITVTGITCGTAPYTLTLLRLRNYSTITRTTSGTTFTFSNLFSGGYTLEIRDSRGNKVTKSLNVGTRSNRTYCR